MSEKVRNYKMDNLRLILIFFVIWGHTLELFPGTIKGIIYCIIYSFHMPVFVFITGYFAKYSQKKIIYYTGYYVVFQTVYLIFDNILFKPDQSLTLQFSTPYWLLWYLLVLIFYYLLIPLIDVESEKTKRKIWGVSCVISLLTGYDNSIGYYASLSRFFTFLPYFICGYYLRKNNRKENLNQKLSMLVIIMMCCIFIYYCKITPAMLYGSNSYQNAEYDIFIKIILLIIGGVWICFWMNLHILDKKIKFLTALGENTFYVFIFHGFIIKLLHKYQVFRFGEITNMFLSILVSILIIILFSNKYIINFIKRYIEEPILNRGNN